MSYHTQKSTGQRSFGLLFVVIFHVILIYGLASGLAGDLSSKVAEVLQTKVVEEVKPDEVVEPPPPPPDTKIPPPDFVPPPSFDFVPDAPVNSTAIQAVQHATPKPVEPSTMTEAKAAGKGFSIAEYPPASQRLGEVGSVTMNIYVSADGKVADVQLKESSGFERLDQAAIKHVQRSWKFIPCMQGDKPMPCWTQKKMTFRLDDAKK